MLLVLFKDTVINSFKFFTLTIRILHDLIVQHFIVGRLALDIS